MPDEKRVWIASVLIMVALVVATPDIDYDSYFRFVVARNCGYSLRYVEGLIWLPVYQYVCVFFNSFVLLRFFSVLCVVGSAVVIRMWRTNNKGVAVATSMFYLLHPFVTLYGSQAMSESLVTFLTLLFIYFFTEEKHVYAVLVLVCGVLTAYSFWVFVPFVLVYGLLKRKRCYFVYFLPVLAIVWWGYTNYALAKEPLHFLGKASVFYSVLKERVLWSGSQFSLLLFPFVYPLMFALPFSVKVFSGKFTGMDSRGKMLLLYLIISNTVLLVAGQTLEYVFGWGRYFIALIPAYLLLGCEHAIKSKKRKLWIALYFLFSFVMTVFEAYRAYDFKVRGMGRSTAHG